LVGKQATKIAIVGTLFPMILGFVFVYVMFPAPDTDGADGSQNNITSTSDGPPRWPAAVAAGCAFAPTSVGISINLLEESKMLTSLAGQTTLTAAFIDDVFSLVTLVIMTKLAEKPPDALDIIVPLVCSFLFLGLGVFLATKVFPRLFPPIFARVPLKKNVSIQPRDELHLLCMFLSLAFFGWLSSGDPKPPGPIFKSNPPIGSHLLGAFVAGMAWVNVPRSHQVWQNQIKRIVKWLMRCFFAASVGFAIPLDQMTKWDAIWKGLVLGFIPCIGTKLVSGLFAWSEFKNDEAKQMARGASLLTKNCPTAITANLLQPTQMLVGIAMVARGEFAYLVAETAQGLDWRGSGTPMMASEVYASVIIALVCATVCAPIMFRWVLGVFDRASPIHRSEYIGGGKERFARRAFVIRLAGAYSPGVQREIFDALHSSGVDILEASLVTVRKDDSPEADVKSFINNFIVMSRGKKKDFDDEKLEEMQHHFAEVLNDADAQIIFEPYDDDYKADGVLEIQVFGEHHSAVLHEMTDKLVELDLDIIRATVHASNQPGHHHELSEHSAVLAGSEASQQPRRSFNEMVIGWASTTNVLARPSKSGTEQRGSTTTCQNDHAKSHKVGREVFYVRENTTGSQYVTPERRAEIEQALHQVLDAHGLHGIIIVRMTHESEMNLAQKVPALAGQNSSLSIHVIKCTGKHQKELLSNICDTIDEHDLEVMHADMHVDETGLDVNTFYVAPIGEGVKLDEAKRKELQDALAAVYADKQVQGQVQIEETGAGAAQTPRRASSFPRRDGSSGLQGQPLHIDTTGDGIADSIAIDTTGDGAVDTIIPKRSDPTQVRPTKAPVLEKLVLPSSGSTKASPTKTPASGFQVDAPSSTAEVV